MVTDKIAAAREALLRNSGALTCDCDVHTERRRLADAYALAVLDAAEEIAVDCPPVERDCGGGCDYCLAMTELRARLSGVVQ